LSATVRFIHSWSCEEYDRILDACGFAPDSRVELLASDCLIHVNDLVPETGASWHSLGLYAGGATS